MMIDDDEGEIHSADDGDEEAKEINRKALEKESDKLYDNCRQLLGKSEILSYKAKEKFYSNMNRIFEISEEINYPKRIVVNGQFKYYWKMYELQPYHNLFTFVCSELTIADLEIAKYVLERTADLSYFNMFGMTALMCAAMVNKREIIKAILGHKDLSQDHKQALIIQDSFNDLRNDKNNPALHVAAEFGSFGAFQELLEYHNADPRFVNKNNENIFHAAARNRKKTGPSDFTKPLIVGDKIVIKGLTDKEIQNMLNSKNKDGKSPYEVAKDNMAMNDKDREFFKSNFDKELD